MSFDFTLQNKCVTVCAKRNSGKTVLISYLIGLEKGTFKKIFLICPTEDIDSYYAKKGIVSPKCVYKSL
jgi:molybdopterin-guanine dinucleotide biosynthesis protein